MVPSSSDKSDQVFTNASLPLEPLHNGRQKSPIRSATNIFSNEVEAVTVQIRRLGVELTAPKTSWCTRRRQQKGPRELLHAVSADLQPSLTAIIGASGSGKTTLLDAISDRVTGRVRISQGTVLFNGRPGVDHIRHAYVTQQDLLLPSLTVRETLQYAADLRLPRTTVQERHAIVESVIAELGLQKCADTRIGNSENQGCSGGEKRRVSIGVQLLANPSLLCLDEPTTGLDAASAFQLASTLRRISQRGRLVMMTIHQPRPEIWALFDNVIVLADGAAVYSGPVSESLPWLESNGFKKPPFVNAADFIIDTTAVDYRASRLEDESRARVGALKQAWHTESELRFSPVSGPECPLHTLPSQQSRGYHTSRFRQVRILTKRTTKVTYRDPFGMLSSITEAVLMGLAVGYMFFDLGQDQAGIKSRQGCLYVTASLQGYLVLILETYRMTLDMPIFDREALEHCVSPAAFIFSRRLARFLTEDVPVPLIFSLLIYFMAGLDSRTHKFFTFYVITMLNHYIAVLCATSCVVISRNFASASLIASLIYTLQSLASGMIVQVDTIPVFVRWTRWITYTFYTFSAYIGNEFQGNFSACPFPGGRNNPKCEQYSGDFAIKTLGFPQHWTGRAIAFMGGFAFFFLCFSIVGLTYLKPTSLANARMPQPPRQDIRLSEAKTRPPVVKMRPVSVELQHFALTLSTKTLRSVGTGLRQETILEPISAKFQPGVLNVILGPSGSGKSSLLNAMAHRLHDSATTKYHPSGRIVFGGISASDRPADYKCSYVHQDGELLLPAMTVRETLRYAAALRLPSSMDAKDRHQRAEEILLKMGLKGCADTLIGNESFRGVSGGERRRVSLAIQILADPEVLLVDEPTSGLDAFTANSIVQVLRDLATEGRTIIMAIHQPRSDLFCYFGNILLLSPSGAPVYSGPANAMKGYFGECGHECPPQMNPADFALDIVSDLYRLEGEAEDSRERVERLLKRWRQQSAASHQHGGNEVQQSNKQSQKSASLRISLPLLIRRALINTLRQPQLVLARIMQSSGIAIVFALFFAQLGDDYSSIQTRLGFFQQLGGFYIIGMLTNAAIYPEERNVAYREIEDEAYTVDAFLASYTIVGLPFEMINSFFFGILAVFAVGLPRTAATYFVASLACFSGLSCGESLGIMFNTLFSHTGFAINLMGIVLALANSMAGVLSLNMPSLYNALNYLSPIRYQVRGVAYYSLRGLSFKCDLVDDSCPISSGDEALRLYKFDEHAAASVFGMLGCVVVYRIVAWLLLRLVRRGP